MQNKYTFFQALLPTQESGFFRGQYCHMKADFRLYKLSFSLQIFPKTYLLIMRAKQGIVWYTRTPTHKVRAKSYFMDLSLCIEKCTFFQGEKKMTARTCKGTPIR